MNICSSSFSPLVLMLPCTKHWIICNTQYIIKFLVLLSNIKTIKSGKCSFTRRTLLGLSACVGASPYLYPHPDGTLRGLKINLAHGHIHSSSILTWLREFGGKEEGQNRQRDCLESLVEPVTSSDLWCVWVKGDAPPSKVRSMDR
jgi:hypothetical protein